MSQPPYHPFGGGDKRPSHNQFYRAPRSGRGQVAYMEAKVLPEGVGPGYDIEKTIDWEEIARHTSRESAWMVLRGKVYDITDYLDLHPGGSGILLQFAGKDATKQFNAAHPWVNFESIIGHRQIGIAPPVRSGSQLLGG